MAGLAIPIPYQWQVGDTGNAALLNAQLFNGLTYLENPPIATLAQTSVQSLAAGAVTTITWPTPAVDTYSGWAAGTPTRYTPQVAGYYLAVANVGFVNNGTGFRMAHIAKNGTTQSETSLSAAPTGFSSVLGITALVSCNGTSDYIEAQVNQSSGAALNSIVGLTNMTIIWIHA